MNMFLLYLAAGTLVFYVIFGIDLYFGNRSTTFLRIVRPKVCAPLPRVSVIIPARNEQRHIREALQSILQQDYPNLEFLVINDRSTDQTAQILAEMTREFAKLRVLTISELPPGWLGKN
jgi:cellulose synthase/poly-beta-1,6-N-acetylglucosamine synthase-like glycosyltransferase